MAMLAGGKVQLQGAPNDLIRQMDGRIWRGAVARADVADLQAAYNVIATRSVEDKVQVTILADNAPGAGFEAGKSGLEDVYLAAVASSRKAG